MRRLRSLAKATHHRLTLVLAGSGDWTLTSAFEALQDGDAIWLTDRPVAARTVPLRAGERLLGRELDTLVYDAHSGLDPDSFGAATGALRGGGLLLLLTPPLEEWPRLTDPQAQRVAVHPFTAAEMTGRFIARFRQVLSTSPGCWILHQGDPLPRLPLAWNWPAKPAQRPAPSAATAATADQQQTVDAIIKAAQGRARRPLVITADRGRGKSAALGLAAAELLAAGSDAILVTAPRRAAVEPVFRHAAAALPETRFEGDRLVYRDRQLAFLPPDGLDRNASPARLLLIDEAAGIPAPLLERALARYPRIVFATTVHGYEGTGRGFEVRFRTTLDRLTPEWRAKTLSQPIRWAEDDPLEALTSRALLLDAAPARDTEVAAVEPADCASTRLDRDELAADEPELRQIFGLLVLAHYQTRPLDVRHLLDGPNVGVQVLRHGCSVVATLLTADEGGFGADLARAIFAGRRRPRGHLLPQTLSAHAGLAEAAERRYRRIVRLAVHPVARGRGLGGQLLDAAILAARADGLDLVGASFGATPQLMRFWLRYGFAPVQLGTHRNAASGEHALVVLHPLTPQGQALVEAAKRRFAKRLPDLLSGPLRETQPDLIAALLAELPVGAADLDEAAVAELRGFAEDQRTLDATWPWLAELARARLGVALRQGRLDAGQGALLIHTVLQGHDPGVTATHLGHQGRSQVVAELRSIAAVLLRQGAFGVG